MAFTYVGDLSTDRDKVRFHLGDTVSGSGPRPADANFTDAEIDGLISVEGTWGRAVAGGFEVLAALWARYVTFSADGASISRSHIAQAYRAEAATWRDRYGAAAAVTRAGSQAVTRADGYSDDIDSVTRSGGGSTDGIEQYLQSWMDSLLTP